MTGFLGFTLAPGALTTLAGRDDKRAYYLFRGDLSQMGTIYETLRRAGFPVVQNDVYPGFQRHEEDIYKQALEFLFQNRIYGWWSQERELVSYSICTQKEFDKALGRLLSPCHEVRIVLSYGIGSCSECGENLTRINQKTFIQEWLDGNPVDTEEALRPVAR